MPEYYYVTVDLVGSLGNLLCPTFTFSEYTKEMQEIYAADIYDFEPEYVVNFDDDETTNFIVLNEDTVIAKSSEGVNTLLVADYDSGIYVFENIDDTISNLQKDDFFFISASETDAIAIAVDKVEVDGNTATVLASDDDIDDMFDFVKFEAISDTSEAIVSLDGADEGVSFNGFAYADQDSSEEIASNTVDYLEYENVEYLSGIGKLNGATILSKAAYEDSRSVNVSFPVEYKKDNISLEANAELGFTLSFNFYKKFKYVNIEVSLECSQEFSVTGSIKASTGKDLSISLGVIDIPTGIPGCYIDLRPKLCLTLTGEAKVAVSYSVSSKIKISYDSDVDKLPKITTTNDGPEGDVSFTAKATVFLGLDLDPKIVILSEALASLTLEAKAGFNITAQVGTNIKADTTGNWSVNSTILVTDTTGNSIHACNFCIDGDWEFIIECKVKLKVLLAKLEAGRSWTFPLGDWYYSDQLGFGFGTCPNLAYKVSFNVYDYSNNSLSGATVIIDSIEQKTGAGGNATFFCSDGTYLYQVRYGESIHYGEFTIKKGGKKIDFKMNANKDIELSSSGDISVTPPTIGTKPTITNEENADVTVDEKMLIVESGQLGENIYYMIYADGFMFVYGSGEMYDRGYNYEHADIVTDVPIAAP